MKLETIVAWIRRETTGLDRGVLVVSATLTLGWGFGLAAGGTSLAGWLAIVRLGLAIVVLGYGLRLARLGPDAALVLAITLVTLALGLNASYQALFGRRLGWDEIRHAVEGIRAGTVPIDLGTVLFGAGLLAVLWVLLTLALRLISLLPRPRRWRGEPRIWLPLGLALATGVSFTTGSPRPATASRDLFTTELEFARLAGERAALLQHIPTATRRLDVLLVVLDSVRHDMLRPEVMPNLSALAGRCLTMRRHYTTGGNTGTGMFGLLSGLAAPYYPLSARARLQPIPLEVLRRLGYRRSVYFVSNIRTYDGIFELLFEGQVEHVYSGEETPTHVADRHLADDLLQQLRSRDPKVPQFSVVMFDSTHYDYSYPPEHERFLPQGTLELGVRDGLIVGAGINERLRGRGPLVRNRQQNAAHWLDALVGDLTAFLGPEGLARTVLVVTSDHGEEFFEKGTFGHGFTLSEEATRVPLVLCAPGGVQTRYTVSSHADVIPTIFDLLGVDAGPAAVVSGKSWLRHDPTLDVALVGAGSTGQRVSRRFAAVGGQGKVIWHNVPPYEREAVWDDQDRPVAAFAPLEADELIARALVSARLRPLPGPP